jgi:hypothetical protein
VAHFPPTYTDCESAILIAIYENPDMTYDTLLADSDSQSGDFSVIFGI